jgi:hypothetical protein
VSRSFETGARSERGEWNGPCFILTPRNGRRTIQSGDNLPLPTCAKLTQP